MTDWDSANTFAANGGPMSFEAHKQPNMGESRTGHFQDGFTKAISDRTASGLGNGTTIPELPGDD